MTFWRQEVSKKLLDTALADPEYMEWTQRSFDYLTGKIPNPETGKFDIPKDKLETRGFDQWHEVSRFRMLGAGEPCCPAPFFVSA